MLSRLIAMLAVVLIGARILRWHDWLFLLLTLAVLVSGWLLQKAVARLNAVPHRYQRHGKAPAEPSFITNVGRGIGVGLLLVSSVTALHAVLLTAPSIQEVVFDRDRQHFEEIASQLEQGRHYLELAELVTGRLAQPISNQWADTLRRKKYDLWIKAGKETGGDASRALYLKAVAAAKEAGMSHELADELLQRLDDAERLAEVEASHQQSSRRSEEAYQQVSDSLESTNSVIYDQLIEWGDSLGNQFPLRQSKYEAAADWAKSHSLNSDAATRRLAELRTQIDALRPIALPAGTSVRLLRENSDCRPPVVILDVAVSNSAGQTVRDLASKDFRIRADGQPLATHSVLITPAAQPIQLVVLVDRSNSTAGPAIEAAKAGVKTFVRDVRQYANIKVLTFGDAVERLTDWTSDADALFRAVDSIQANGSTALLKGLDASISDVESRSEPRAIVLITDGKDHVGGPAAAELIARCRKSAVAIHTVGLKTAELDTALLQQLSTSTGGSYQTSERTSDLAKHFTSLAAQLRNPFYRVVFQDDGKVERVIELQVGLSSPALRLPSRSTN